MDLQWYHWVDWNLQNISFYSKVASQNYRFSVLKSNLPLLLGREMFLLTSDLLPVPNQNTNQMVIDFIPSSIEVNKIRQRVIQTFGIGSSRFNLICHFQFTGYYDAAGRRQSAVHMQKEYYKHRAMLNGVCFEFECCAIASKQNRCQHRMWENTDETN